MSMSETKRKIIDEIIQVEGGYVDHPLDSGGPTMYGITEKVARENGYIGLIQDLPKNIAFNIYEKKYWSALKLDTIYVLSPEIAEELADTGVNMGVGRAGEFLQRSLNVLNKRGVFYKDIKVDGAVGPATISAFKSFYDSRGGEGLKILCRMLNCLQGAYYVTLAERREKDEVFIFGWFRTRVK